MRRRTLLLGLMHGFGPALAGCASTTKGSPSLTPVVSQPPSSAGEVTARFLGTSSILFQDKDTTILSDGFLTRPTQLARIQPDKERIRDILARLEVDKIAAVFTVHSHYDHALDSAFIAKQTEAKLLGSESTKQLGLGEGLSPTQICVVREGETYPFGRFALTFIASKHSEPELWPGTIRRPVVPPAPVTRWRTGGAWSVIVQHGQRRLLVHASANYRENALQGQRVEVVYLGIGGLGLRRRSFVESYWNEVVVATGARRVILVHWDNLLGTRDPLQREPTFDRAHEWIRSLAGNKVEVLLPELWQRTDPFQGMP